MIQTSEDEKANISSGYPTSHEKKTVYSGNLHKANSAASGPDAHFGEYEILPTDLDRGPRGGRFGTNLGTDRRPLYN